MHSAGRSRGVESTLPFPSIPAISEHPNDWPLRVKQPCADPGLLKGSILPFVRIPLWQRRGLGSMQECQKGSPARGQWCPETSQLPYARGLTAAGLGSGDSAALPACGWERDRVTRGKGWPEMGLPVSGSGAWSVSPAPAPPQVLGAQLLLYPVGWWGCSTGAGGGTHHCHGASVRAVAVCRCWWMLGQRWLLCYSFLGGLGNGRHVEASSPHASWTAVSARSSLHREREGYAEAADRLGL